MTTSPPLSAPRTFLDALERAHAAGDDEGFTFVGDDGAERTIGFRSLVEEARARGRRMRGLGLARGDRVALVIPDAADFVLTFLGAVSAGILPVPLYPPLSLGRLDAYLDQTVRILRAASTDLIVTSQKVQHLLWSAVPRVPSVRDLVPMERVATGAAPDLEPPALSPEDPAFLQFTSGSTSHPKGVVVTHGSLCANAMAIMRDGLDADHRRDRGVSWLPLYHDMGLIGFVLAPLATLVPVVFLPTLSFVKRPTMWMDAIHRHRGTITFAPNFAYARVTKRASDRDLEAWDLSCLRVAGCGAEPIHAGTMRAFVGRFAAAKLDPAALMPCYGMAEATLAMAFAPLGDPLHVDTIDPDRCYEDNAAVPTSSPTAGSLELVSCGRTFPRHDIAIFSQGGDRLGERLGERQIGEICFRGPSVAAGYFRNREATEATFRGGWLHTGDLGYLADGHLYVSGRVKDILIVHGRNYYPQAIEWLVEAVPGVRKGNVVAFSVPGAASESVVIVAEASVSAPEERAELASRIQAHLTGAMGLVPGDVVLLGRGELPKTTSGKVQRQKTRQQYRAGTLGSEGVRSLGGNAERLTVAKHIVKSFIGRIRHRTATLLRSPLRAPRKNRGDDSVHQNRG